MDSYRLEEFNDSEFQSEILKKVVNVKLIVENPDIKLKPQLSLEIPDLFEAIFESETIDKTSVVVRCVRI